MCLRVVPGEGSVKVDGTRSHSTYRDINAVHIHIALHRLMHGLVFKLALGQVNLALRNIALCD